VTFTEYGNTETVTLGEIDFRDAPGTGGGGGGGGGYDRRGGGRANDRGSDDYSRRNNDYRDNSHGYSGRDGRDEHRSRGYARGDDRRDRDRWDRDGDRERDFNRGRDRYGGGRPRSKSRSRDRSDDPYDTRTGGTAARSTTGSSELDERSLMDEVLRREREKSTASGKAYAARPPTCKTSLAVDSDGARDSDRQKKSSYEYAETRGHPNDSRSAATSFSQHASSAAASSTPVPPQSTRKKTPEELAVIEDKKRKLMAKYG